MKYCRMCILPETRPNLEIGPDGICNACRTNRTKRDIDWSQRQSEFEILVKNAKTRATGYDCLVAVSGGKDSTWQVIKCLEYGLRVLAVTWRTPMRTEIGQQNLDNLISLGVDHIDYTVNPDVESRFIWHTFREKGTPAIPMHLGIFYIPLNIAARFDIPLIVYGENPNFEYGSKHDKEMGFELNEDWLMHNGITHGTTAVDWVGGTFSRKELSPYFGPDDHMLQQKDVRAIFLGYYFDWDPQVVFNIVQKHGFRRNINGPRTGFYDYADIDDDSISVHHFMKWPKFGFTRAWDNLSIEIRTGRISRDNAIQILAERGDETPERDIARFCEYTGATRQEFDAVVEQFRNQDIWRMKGNHWEIENYLIPGWKWQ